MIVNSNRIKLEMARQILTLEDLRKRSGLSLYGLRKVISGKSNPTPSTIGRLSKALGLDPSELIVPDEITRSEN